jgi:hypothetical protein
VPYVIRTVPVLLASGIWILLLNSGRYIPLRNSCGLKELGNYRVNSRPQWGFIAIKSLHGYARATHRQIHWAGGGVGLVEISMRSYSTFMSEKKPGDDWDYWFEAFSD